MNPSHRLEKLHQSAGKRLAKLRPHVSHLNAPIKFDDDVVVAWAAIEAVNLWSGFLRAYYLSGAIDTRTRSGDRVHFTAAKFGDTQAALRFAIRMHNPKFAKTTLSRRDEPAWHNTQDFIKLQKAVGASNLPQIHSALAAGSNFAPLLKNVRNFYAHRCDETFRKAASVGIKLGLTPRLELQASRILCSRLPRRPQNVISDWLDDMANVFDLLCS